MESIATPFALPAACRYAALKTIRQDKSKLLRPKEKLNIWQWAEKNRVFAKGVSVVSKHGPVPYRVAYAPHQKEIQESITDPLVQVNVLQMASQVGGKTEIILNAQGYFTEHDPRNQIVMYPTIEASEKFSKKKLAPMIASSPVLEKLFHPSRSRDSGNTILVKEFIGGSIFLIGANSAASLRGATGSVLFADEIDTKTECNEGDPIELLFKRGESYDDVVKVLASTPTIPGAPIDFWFNKSDQRYWFVPCPACGVFHTFVWKNVIWPKGSPEDAYMLCDVCHEKLQDGDRIKMYFAGRWQATAPFKGVRGFHLNHIYCPWPAHKSFKNRLHQMAEEFLRAVKKGSAALRVWTNTAEVKTFTEQDDEKPSATGLIARCESYGGADPKNPVIIQAACLLTAAVDVQINRLEVEVVAHGQGEETWGVEKLTFPGNPHNPDTWKPLDDLLSKNYRHESGNTLRIIIMLIDSGDGKTKKAVYTFVNRRQPRRVYAIKGSSVANSPLLATANSQKKKGASIRLFTIGTDTGKATIYAWLNIEEPGPRYMHFPKGFGYDDEYFAQLTAESVHTIYRKGVSIREWKKDRERNEGLDLRVYTLAAIEILRPNMQKLAALVSKKIEPQTAIQPGQVVAVQPPRRRIMLPGRYRR